MSKEKRLGLYMTAAVLAAVTAVGLMPQGCTGKKKGKEDRRSAGPAPRKTARPAGDAGAAKPRPSKPEGPAVGVNVDFTQFIPRGHYTRSRRLKRYFRAMMWLGLSGFPLPDRRTPKRLTVQALLMTRGGIPPCERSGAV